MAVGVGDARRSASVLPIEAELPFGIICSFLFFLARRPISRSNGHYLASRLAGLKSLIPVLEQSDLPAALRQALRELKETTPASFAQRVRQLQMRFLAVGRGDIDFPADFVVTHRPPPRGLDDLAALRLICGPSIGIGDEIIFFPLVSRLKRAGVQRVEVMTTYPRIWERVGDADSVTGYSEHRELLNALRAPQSAGAAVALVDFEKPGLAQLMVHEPAIERYLELSLGAQTAVLVDRRERSVRAFRGPTEHVVNYYEGLDRMLRWLGIPVDRRDRFSGSIVARAATKPAGELRVFVSPFTSKYDPSSLFWARMVADLFQARTAVPVRVRIDAGANRDTATFADVLRRSVVMRVPTAVEVEVAHGAGTPALPLSDVQKEIDAAQLVLCADSFVAHAAPLFGCVTLVVAGRELANWRVPGPCSFYFDAEHPVERLIAAMRAIIARRFPDAVRTPEPVARPPRAILRAAALLAEITAGLENALAAGGEIKVADFERFAAAYELVIDALPVFPPALAPLLDDEPYPKTLRCDLASISLEEVQDHLRSQIVRWSNTNLRKFVGLAETSGAHRSEAVGS